MSDFLLPLSIRSLLTALPPPHRFDYLARRALWKWERDELEEQRRELGGEVIKLDDSKKRSKWKEACCS